MTGTQGETQCVCRHLVRTDVPVVSAQQLQKLNDDFLTDMRDPIPHCSFVDDETKVEDVSSCLARAVQQYLAESVVSSEDEVNIVREEWRAVVDAWPTVATGVGKAVHFCLLYRCWHNLDFCRQQNHRAGLCSHYGRQPEGAPKCERDDETERIIELV